MMKLWNGAGERLLVDCGRTRCSYQLISLWSYLLLRLTGRLPQLMRRQIRCSTRSTTAPQHTLRHGIAAPINDVDCGWHRQISVGDAVCVRASWEICVLPAPHIHPLSTSLYPTPTPRLITTSFCTDQFRMYLSSIKFSATLRRSETLHRQLRVHDVALHPTT